MRRHHSTLLLTAIVAAGLAPAASAAGRPPRDSGVACARADNTYCLSGGDTTAQPPRGGGAPAPDFSRFTPIARMQ